MKRLLIALTLMCVLSVTALAGDIPMTGPCTPGETSGPPCGDMGGGGLADDGNQGTGGLALLILDLLF